MNKNDLHIGNIIIEFCLFGNLMDLENLRNQLIYSYETRRRLDFN